MIYNTTVASTASSCAGAALSCCSYIDHRFVLTQVDAWNQDPGWAEWSPQTRWPPVWAAFKGAKEQALS